MAGEVRLADVAEIIMGQSPPGETYNEVGDGLPFFQGVADFNYRHPTPPCLLLGTVSDCQAWRHLAQRSGTDWPCERCGPRMRDRPRPVHRSCAQSWKPVLLGICIALDRVSVGNHRGGWFCVWQCHAE